MDYLSTTTSILPGKPYIVAAVAGATIGALTFTGGIVPIATAVGDATLLLACAVFHKCFLEELIPMERSEHKLGIRYLKTCFLLLINYFQNKKFPLKSIHLN